MHSCSHTIQAIMYRCKYMLRTHKLCRTFRVSEHFSCMSGECDVEGVAEKHRGEVVKGDVGVKNYTRGRESL